MGFKQMHVPPIPKGISAATTVPEFATHYANIKMSRRKTVIVLQHNGRFKVRSSGEVDKKVHCKCIQQHLFYDYYHNIQQHFEMSCLKGIPMLYHAKFKCKTYLSVILVRLQIYGISLPHSPFFLFRFWNDVRKLLQGLCMWDTWSRASLLHARHKRFHIYGIILGSSELLISMQ